MGRRWAATYIFHLGQIQLPSEGKDGEYNNSRSERTERYDTRGYNEMRFLAMYNTCSPLTCVNY